MMLVYVVSDKGHHEYLLDNHNLASYDCSKNKLMRRDIKYHKIPKCIFFITNWFRSGVAQLTI